MRKKSLHRILAFSLSGAMLLGMAGCGKKDEGTTAATKDTTVSTAAATEKKTEAATEPATEAVTEAKKEDINVKPGDVIVSMDFEDGETGKFAEYRNGGDFEMTNDNGKLKIHILRCGSCDYANQIYYDGYQLLQGAEYTISFDVSSSIERIIQYRGGQLNGGDYHAYQEDNIKIGPEEQHISADFVMSEESDPAPRLVFNMGIWEGMNGDPGEHDIFIDNIKLEVKDVTNAQVLEGLPDYPKVNVSQIGYLPGDSKQVVVKSQNTETFQVIDTSTNKEVYTGSFGPFAFHAASDELVRVGDFTEVNTPGTYKIVTDVGETYEFKIGEGIYDEIFTSTVRMLFLQRCGINLSSAEAGDFAHPECHMTEATVYGTSEKKDVTGGWHDAGDYGRYVVAGAKAVQDLLLAYEDYGIKNDDMDIPESGNGVPDILDEARYELNWMLKMQDEKSGGVYHKVSGLVFPETVAPDAETAELVLAPISVTATADFAAVMAKASQTYQAIDADFAKKCYDAAVKAWGYIKGLNGNYEGYKNPEDIVTGEYPDNGVKDEIFWAASELYLAGYADVKDDLKPSLDAVPIGSELGWADISGYAYYDILRQKPEGINDVVDEVNKRFFTRVEQLAERADSYGMMLESNYPWGSNMSIANFGMLMRMASNLTGDDTYKNLSKRQLDYLLGANPLGYCFVTGFGVVSPKQPHHRPSQVAGKAVEGMLVGGADNALEDSYAKAVLYGQPAAMCYADNAQSFSTNEVAIYWNSPLIYLLAASK